MSDANRADLELIAAAAREAGDLALGFFRGAARQWNKPDDTVVTEADIAVDALLHERLTAARPDYGWLSEERPDDGSRLSAKRTFIVDPIDGTRAFVDGGDEWVVSIGVVENGSPAAGALFNPVRGEIWTASAAGGAHRDGVALRVSGRSDLSTARIAASRKAIAQAGLDDIRFVADRRFMKSLANRLAQVASGEIDGALATARSADWDLAAALLIVQEAGGCVTGFDGAPVNLNAATTRHAAFLAAGPALHEALLARFGGADAKN